ncbi:hypothetical protein HMPREF6485_1143 [Segatella buccae ATCC 33574]|uniref:Uncharacterized protein n=1 Tax=Segatella buccae ATCC 33574 TaxID=873513 RepID=E6K6A9_9BACT|nr:hypothetical protein HMPREF6485_1143 [Segatella buccae ATCC 33574]
MALPAGFSGFGARLLHHLCGAHAQVEQRPCAGGAWASHRCEVSFSVSALGLGKGVFAII